MLKIVDSLTQTYEEISPGFFCQNDNVSEYSINFINLLMCSVYLLGSWFSMFECYQKMVNQE